MNFFVVSGHGAGIAVLSVTLDKSAQAELTALFTRLADEVVASDHVPFDPGFRADEGEIVTISPYALPAGLASLESASAATSLRAVTAADLESGGVRGILGVAWKSGAAHRMVVQRLEARYLLRPEGRRFMLAGNRFVRDDRSGLEIPERVDAVLENATLYVAAWRRAHSVLDLSSWTREATLAEAETFLNDEHFALPDDFDVSKVIDSAVRRKITSISQNRVLERATPLALREYAARFDLDLEVEKGRIVLPAEKKQFKAVLSLLDEDFLLFEPTHDHWIVNSKRRPSSHELTSRRNHPRFDTSEVLT